MGIIWQEIVRLQLVDTMRAKLHEKHKSSRKSSTKLDKFVLIRVQVAAHNALLLNQRQLWFLGQMQQGYTMQAGDLVSIWSVHAKTAGRDIKGLLDAKLIDVIKTGRKCRYESR